MTIETALKDLRQMFPKGHLRVEASATDADKGDDPEGDSTSYARITISRATSTSAKSFQGLTLADCVAQVKAWKESN